MRKTKNWKKNVSLLLAMVMAVSMAAPVRADAKTADAFAAQEECAETGHIPEQVTETAAAEELYLEGTGEGNATGTLGESNGITWVYDAGTKTLTISGEDELHGEDNTPDPFYFICNSYLVEKIVAKDCTLNRSAFSLFRGLKDVKEIDCAGMNTDNVTSMRSMFAGCGSLTSLDLSGFNTGKVTDMRSMFAGCGSLTSLDLSGFNTGKVTDMRDMFGDCGSLTSLDLSGFNTDKVTDMGYMFDDCRSLTSLDLGGFDTGNVTDMGDMFRGCYSLTSLDLSGFNTGKVTDMRRMFFSCTSLTSLDLSGFNTGKVTDMGSMFEGCYSLTSLDLSGFNTSKVTDMGYMFDDCRSLTSLDLSGFNTGNVTDMESMFDGCGSLTSLDVSSFNTGNVTDMERMFKECGSLTSLDLSGFNTGNVTSMEWMFDGCESLTSLDLSGFNTDNVTSMLFMFCGCGSLTELDLSSFNIGLYVSTAGMLDDITPATIRTPYSIQGKIALSGNYQDEDGEIYQVLTADNAGKKLIKIGEQVSEVRLNTYNIVMETVAETYQLLAEIYPEDAYDKSLTWSSSDEAVATVDENGLVTAVGEGSAEIRVTASNGCSTYCRVVVPKTIICSSAEEMESSHDYENDSRVTWIYTKKNAESLTITFDERTELEESYDYLRIYDAKDNLLGEYTGTELAGKELRIEGDTVKIKLITDSSETRWGFKVTKAESVGGEENTDISYAITYNLNGGTNASDNPTQGSSGTEISLKDAARTGCYRFAGWYTENTFKNRITVIPAGTEKDVVLYAKWEEIDHTFDKGKVTTAPTCIAKGIMTYTCTVCGAEKTEEIPLADHDYEEVVTKATLKKDGRIASVCTVCGDVEEETVISYPKTIALSVTSYSYNGKVKKPAVKVTAADGKTIDPDNYKVAYAKGCKDVGAYKVTVTFRENYTGSKALEFVINPAPVKLKSVTAGSKKLTVKWTKNAKQTTGYEIAYSTNKNFAKAATKTVVIKKNSTVSKAITKLKAKKKYYVRIRAYKDVAKKKYYSEWSAVKSVTTKK